MPTKIEWADDVFNPWTGCEKVSPGCAHCYAEKQAARFDKGLWGAGHVVKFKSNDYWKKPRAWARNLPAKLGRRPRIFCASMADVFEEREELLEPRARLFQTILETPELDWLVLTKRPEFACDWLDGFYDVQEDLGVSRAPLPNLWMGVSIENARYTWRADVLREIPAAVRFISAEPLLGSLYHYPKGDDHVVVQAKEGRLHADGAGTTPDGATAEEIGLGARRRASLNLSGIDWVIIGGESGPKSRPFHIDHAREIIQHATVESYERTNYAEDNAVAVFVKQLGAKPFERAIVYAANCAAGIECEHGYDVCPICDAGEIAYPITDSKGGNIDEFPHDLQIREFPRVQVAA